MKDLKKVYSRKIIISLIVSTTFLFITSLYSYALSKDTLRVPVGTAYQRIIEAMEERYKKHEEAIDRAIDRLSSRAKPLRTLPELQDEYIVAMKDVKYMQDMKGRNVNDRLNQITARGEFIQVIFVDTEGDLPEVVDEETGERKKVWEHAGIYITVFAVRSNGETEDALKASQDIRRRIVGRIFHGIRARSTLAMEMFEREGEDITLQRANELQEALERENLQIQREIEIYGRIVDRRLNKEFAGLEFDEKVSIKLRDYTLSSDLFPEVWEPSWNPLKALEDPAVRDVFVRLLRLKYEKHNLDTMLVPRVLRILGDHIDNPEAAQRAVYKTIIRFTEDAEFSKAYREYHKGSKFKPTLELFSPYIELLCAGRQSEVIAGDIGCGNNTLGEVLVGLHKGLRVIGTEINARTPHIGERLEFREQSSPIRLPFENGELDVAFLHAIQHHVFERDWPLLLKELKRVVKPGGMILLFEDSYSLLVLSFPDLEDRQLLDDFLALSERQKKLYYALNDWYANVLVSENPMPFPFQFKSLEHLTREARQHADFIPWETVFKFNEPEWFHQPPVIFAVLIRPFMDLDELRLSSLLQLNLIATRQDCIERGDVLGQRLAERWLIALSLVDEEAKNWVEIFIPYANPGLNIWSFESWILEWLDNHKETPLDTFFSITQLTYNELKRQNIRLDETMLFIRRVLDELYMYRRGSVSEEWYIWFLSEAFVSEESAQLAEEMLRFYLCPVFVSTGTHDSELWNSLHSALPKLSDPAIKSRVERAIHNAKYGDNLLSERAIVVH